MINRRRQIIAIATAIALTLPGIAAAQQYSASYKFLQAVRKRDGTVVTEILNEPGTTVIDTKDRTNGETALVIVTRRRDTQWLSFLLSRGADPNIRSGGGETPLIAAAELGFSDGVQLLLGAKADIELTNGSGETALIRAVQNRDLAMVRLLLTNGADADKTDRVAGMSARDYAASDPRGQAIAKLIADTPKSKKRAVAGPKL